MKSVALFIVFILAASTFAPEPAKAAPSSDVPTLSDAIESLQLQLEKIRSESPRQCPANYANLLASDRIRVSIYYGYQDFDAVTTDRTNSHAFAAVLKQPCVPGIAACGFKQTSKSSDSIVLEKVVNQKRFIVTIRWTSISDNNLENMDAQAKFWDQDKHSREVKEKFYRSLVNDDVVIYSGHSRIGAGLGFDPQSAVQEGFNYLFRGPLQPILQALGSRPSRLKLLALMACESARYYEKDIRSVNPRISLALTNEAVEDDESERIQLGLLDSILAQKCEKDLKASLKAADFENDRMMKVVAPRGSL